MAELRLAGSSFKEEPEGAAFPELPAVAFEGSVIETIASLGRRIEEFLSLLGSDFWSNLVMAGEADVGLISAETDLLLSCGDDGTGCKDCK